MFTILGATGHTGGAVADSLLEAGEKIRVVGRSAERLAPLGARGAEAFAGDQTDAETLRRAFDGATGVYAMVPPDYASADPLGHYARVADAVADAATGAGVGRLVVLSSLGAEHAAGTGPIVGLHRLEQRLADTGIDQVHLRPGYFYDNFLGSLGLIKSQGVNGGAIEPEVPFVMTSTTDIGRAAAEELLKAGPGGVTVRELLGPRNLTMRQATTVLGTAIGKPELAYVRFPDEAFAAALVEAGFSDSVAALFVEMSAAISDGRVASHQGRTEETSMPTPLEELAPTFAAAWQAL